MQGVRENVREESSSRKENTNILCFAGLTSYKLANFVSGHIEKSRPDLAAKSGNIQEIELAIRRGGNEPGLIRGKAAICSRTARRWLHRLGFSWKEIKKGIFIDGHERPDVVEYRKEFLEEMQRLSAYFVEFAPDGQMMEKIYPGDCQVGGPNAPIIPITHDESIFSANDGRREAWVAENDTYLRPKGKGKGIMVSEFLLPWSRLNLFSLPKSRQQELENAGLPLEATVFFEYGKDDGHWDGKLLLRQAVDKALPIAEALYPGYRFLFFFDNATSHSVYADDALRTAKMNKGDGGQQPFLRNGWFRDGEATFCQEMWYTSTDPLTGNQVRTQKGIQRVLQERGLWPAAGLNLECPKPKCQACKNVASCKVCIKGVKCDSCKRPKVHSSTCGNGRECDACVKRRKDCTCVSKKFCPSCDKKKIGKCEECEQLPAKCMSNGKIPIPYIKK